MIGKNNPHARFLLLENGDLICPGDEYYNNFKDAWRPVEPDFIGEEFNFDESKPIRRPNPNFDWATVTA